MTHTYQLTGMTCTGCEAKVKSNLLALPDVTSVEVSKENNTATISMEKHIPIASLQEAIGGKESKYQITSPPAPSPRQNESFGLAKERGEEASPYEPKSWFATYKPLLLIFAFIAGVSFIASANFGDIPLGKEAEHINSWMNFMNNFMAGFFIVFSFFKFLDLKGFAESYAMYDVVAMKLKIYGYIYPFIELTLGVAYLTRWQPQFTNFATIVVMGISSIGVIKSVLNKQKIQCACLGAVFNLPMSTVTIIEDLLMVGMAVGMLVFGG